MTTAASAAEASRPGGCCSNIAKIPAAFGVPGFFMRRANYPLRDLQNGINAISRRQRTRLWPVSQI
ncbi:hypothetical protein DC366_13960 [Pelagivirga sediminicola]|uniref:Uncharacterized protein n=1 Tax=Pelagivirga sediminicola TaxID=2170575 RepID=A0A2T7G512_9RHOB|nr:hypothetical protein DC366_13960 [Pelagivirga sediminicola]